MPPSVTNWKKPEERGIRDGANSKEAGRHNLKKKSPNLWDVTEAVLRGEKCLSLDAFIKKRGRKDQWQLENL